MVESLHQENIPTSAIIGIGLNVNFFPSTELPNGKTEFGKTINNNPEKYFTDEVMERLETVCNQYFKYGNNENRTDDNQESDTE